jgi:hypothetical protein
MLGRILLKLVLLIFEEMLVGDMYIAWKATANAI